MPVQLSLNELPGVFVVSLNCCKKGVIPLGWDLSLVRVREMSSSLWSSPWKQWFSCRPSPWVTTETDFPPVVGGQALTYIPCGKCQSRAAAGGHSNLLTFFSWSCLGQLCLSCSRKHFLCIQVSFPVLKYLFYFCVRVVTHVDFCPKTCACGIQCFSCLWCFLIKGQFNIKKLNKMAAV